MTAAPTRTKENASENASKEFTSVSKNVRAPKQEFLYSNLYAPVLIHHGIKHIRFIDFINQQLKINLSNINGDTEYGFRFSSNDNQNDTIKAILTKIVDFISGEISKDYHDSNKLPNVAKFKASETAQRIAGIWKDERSEIRVSINDLLQKYNNIPTLDSATAKPEKKKRGPKNQQFDASKIAPITSDQEFRSFNQAMLHAAIDSPDTEMIFAFGAGGGGKTHVPIEYWVRNLLGRVPLTIFRPKTTTSQKDPPTLPGGEAAKNRQFFKPLNNIFSGILSDQDIENLIKHGFISQADSDFVRGETLKNKYVLIDEAQNLTIKQVDALQSRYGDPANQEGVTKFIFTGDISDNQNDLGLKYPGLLYLLTHFMAAVAKDPNNEYAKTLAFIQFSNEDSCARAASGKFRLSALSQAPEFNELGLDTSAYTNPKTLFLTDKQKELLRQVDNNRAITQNLYDRHIADLMKARFGADAQELFTSQNKNAQNVISYNKFELKNSR